MIRPKFQEAAGPVKEIRTGFQEDDWTDSDGTSEEGVGGGRPDDGNETTQLRYHQNLTYMELAISTTFSFQLKETGRQMADGRPVVLIVKPTASKLNHELLNPYHYRGIDNLGDLENLAELLDSSSNWREMCESIRSNSIVQEALQDFRSISRHDSEVTVEFHFMTLVTIIRSQIGVSCFANSQRKVIVGGFMAKDEFDYRSQTDTLFYNSLNMLNLLATEVKRDAGFGDGDMWYHDERSCQLFAAMYAFNCPTLMITPTRWKLIVENKARDQVLTLPFHSDPNEALHVNASAIGGVGRVLVDVIVICLLSKRRRPPNAQLARIVTESAVVTPTASRTKETQKDTSRRPSKRVKALRGDPRPLNPRFLAGVHDDGSPIYKEVRILPEEQVLELEQEINNQIV